MAKTLPLVMRKERMLELLAYASICFAHATSPFETIHLAKKEVTLDECIDLSCMIANILDDNVMDLCGTDPNTSFKMDIIKFKNLMAQSEKEFLETQQ